MIKKIWIVRNSATSIQFGGLERLFIHLNKPCFFKKRFLPRGESPFDDDDDKCGIYINAGWKSDDGKIWTKSPISVGNWLGYDNNISNYIWEKLQQHFGCPYIELWDIVEANGIAKQEDFILELDIKIKFA